MCAIAYIYIRRVKNFSQQNFIVKHNRSQKYNYRNLQCYMCTAPALYKKIKVNENSFVGEVF